MKRAIAVSAGTLAGLAAVLALNPDDPTLTAAEQVPTAAAPSTTPDPTGSSADDSGSSADDSTGSSAGGTSPGAEPDTTTSPTTSPSTGISPSTGTATDGSGSSTGNGSSGGAAATSGTFTGTEVSVRNFGVIQVQITTDNGTITAIEATQVPDWDRKSEMISSYSVPELVSQALDAQSADIAGISGATFTSMGFSESLQAAMAKAGLG